MFVIDIFTRKRDFRPRIFEENFMLKKYCEKILQLESRLIILNIVTKIVAANVLELGENLALCRVMDYRGIYCEEITRV